MKNNLKLLSITTILSIFLASPFSAFADVSAMGQSGAQLNDLSLTPAKEAKLKKETDNKDKLAGNYEKNKKAANGTFQALSSTINVIYVENFQQETGYWCGPASARQTLSFHKNKSGSSTSLPSQTTLASNIGTTTDGSTTTGIASGLNSYSGTFGTFGYAASDLTDQSDPLASYKSRVNYDLGNNSYAPVVLLQTSYLPRYNGTNIRHYNTVSGYYNDNAGTEQIRLIDPNNSTTYYGSYWDAIGSTTVNGAFRATYQADVAGTNKAMAW